MLKYEELRWRFFSIKYFLPVDIPLIPQTSSDQDPSSSQEVVVLKWMHWYQNNKNHYNRNRKICKNVPHLNAHTAIM